MTIVNIDDLRPAARRRLPKLFFDYIDGGSFAEEIYRRNKDDFSLLRLRQHVLVDYAEPDLSTEYLGRRHSLPFMLGLVGLLGSSLCLRSCSCRPGPRRPCDRDIASRVLDYLGFDGCELDRRPKGTWLAPYIQTVTTNAGERK
ncbi:alpha-hydroxy-acid oxidizing protein [Rhizobium sp. LjRoot258]